MKKTLVFISMLALSTLAVAQKGSFYVGGVVGFGSSTSKDASSGVKDVSSTWTFGPEVGTFLKDDIQLGLVLGLGGSTDKSNDVDETSSSNFSPTIYVRKMYKVTDAFNLFAGLYFNYLSGSTTDYTGPSDVEFKYSGFGIRLGVGVTYALSPRFTAVGQYGLMGFQSVTNKRDGTKTSTDSDFDFGVNTVGASSFSQGNGSGSVFNIGIYYTFKQKSAGQ